MADYRHSALVFSFGSGLISGFGAYEALFVSKLSQTMSAIINLTFFTNYAIFSTRDSGHTDFTLKEEIAYDRNP